MKEKFYSKWIPFVLVLVSITYGCTSLDENLNDKLTREQAAVEIPGSLLLEGAYASFAEFQDQARVWALMTHTSDQMAGPTRGTDWDDGGVWRALHAHTWNTTNPFVVNSFNGLLAGVNDATNVLGLNVTASEAAQARFIRAFHLFHVVDLWGQAPVREPGEDLTEVPSITLTRRRDGDSDPRLDAADWLIGELEPNINDFPTSGGANLNSSDIATKYAAHALLAKIYLQRAVWRSADLQPPSTFPMADMDKVIENCDAIIGGPFALEADYYENFSPTNGETSSELIFVSRNSSGQDLNTELNDVQSRYRMSLHYNQNPSSWNGFVVLTDLYNLMEDGDIRKTSDPNVSNLPSPTAQSLVGLTGMVPGLIVGQQVDKDGNNLNDRPGDPLVFTTDFSLTASNERKGIRQMKYIPDFANNFDFPETDYVLLRLSDIWLMKAEAMFRKGNASEALSMINTLRMARGASQLTNISLEEILNERNRELWIEGWARTDQIRFGTFLDAAQEKPATSSTYLLFPLPPEVLAGNPNLEQNPGY